MITRRTTSWLRGRPILPTRVSRKALSISKLGMMTRELMELKKILTKNRLGLVSHRKRPENFNINQNWPRAEKRSFTELVYASQAAKERYLLFGQNHICTHIGTQSFRDGDGTVGILIIFQNGNRNTGGDNSGTV